MNVQDAAQKVGSFLPQNVESSLPPDIMSNYRQTATNNTKKTNKALDATTPGAKTVPGEILKKGVFRTFRISHFFDSSQNHSRLGHIGVRSGYGGAVDPNRSTIYLGQFKPLTKENSRFHNFYAVKTAVFLVGVSGFEPEVSWTRTKRDTKLRHTPKSHIL